MQKNLAVATWAFAFTALLAGVTMIGAQSPKIKRINQAIELLEQGQPVYYSGSHSGTAGTYEQGVKYSGPQISDQAIR